MGPKRCPGAAMPLLAPFIFLTFLVSAEPASARLHEIARGANPPNEDPTAATIGFNFGVSFDPITDGEPAIPASLRASAPSAGVTASWLVQLRHAALAGEREGIEALGGSIFWYQPELAYLVRATPEAIADVEALPYVRWVGAYHPLYKIDPDAKAPAGSESHVVVLFFPDADFPAARAEIQAAGALVVEATATSYNKLMRLRIDGGLVADLARRRDVVWIEPALEFTAANANVQWVVQTNVVSNRRVWDHGIRGAGQVVHMSDSGIRTTHNAFRDDAVSITTWGQYPDHRKIIAYEPATSGRLFGDHSGASYHGTHTAGTVCGNDAPFSLDLRDGVAPDAKVYFHDAGDNANSVFPPSDLTTLFQPAYDGNDGGAARLSSNSWSSTLSAGDYTNYSRACDQFTWANRDFLIHCSNGNLIAPHTVGAPATNKNGIGSGATKNSTSANLMMEQSSQGPCEDGRLKPTVIAPGESISSAYGANDTGYRSLTGTSMSCPATAGASALVRQYYLEGWYPSGVPTPADGFNPSAALVKATLIASTANDMTGHAIPDNIVGWGRVNLDAVLYFDGDTHGTLVADEDVALNTNEWVDFEFEVTDDSIPLKVALSWSDREGSTSSVIQLVNDLDLTITDPLGVPHLGNVMTGGESVPGGVADRLNVEEGFRRLVPLVGTWTVRVTARSAALDPQPFALVVTGGLGTAVAVSPGNPVPGFALRPVVPNPSRAGSTVFRYRLGHAAAVALTIFDVGGRHVRTLVAGIEEPGERSIPWNGLDAGSRAARSGVYFYRLEAGAFEATRKLVLAR